jgi:protease-4
MKQLREWMAKLASSRLARVIGYLVVLGIALVAAYYLAAALIPAPKIGIIEIRTGVDTLLAERMANEINYVRDARDIKGVVLVINSPGGSAPAGSDIYYQLRSLRAEKPVVVSIDSLAASGAYQISVGANQIYAKPSSIIGNVGVIFQQPSPGSLSEQLVTSGPFKESGGSSTSYMQKLQLLYADFRDSVVNERLAAPNPLKLSPERLGSGEIWVGIEAEKYGLIDALGSRLDAIDAVARLAHLKHYQVVSVRDEYLASLEAEQAQTALKLYEAVDSQPQFDLATTQDIKWPSFYQLYLPLE